MVPHKKPKRKNITLFEEWKRLEPHYRSKRWKYGISYHITLNVEFQRRARRDKKAFLNEQCKEIEENNRMGKTRDLLKKIGFIKGTFHARMGRIKDRNNKDLLITEAEEIKKKWQKYKNYTRKVLSTQMTTKVQTLTYSWAFWSVRSSGP